MSIARSAFGTRAPQSRVCKRELFVAALGPGLAVVAERANDVFSAPQRYQISLVLPYLANGVVIFSDRTAASIRVVLAGGRDGD